MANCLDCRYCVYGPLYDANDALPEREGYKCLLRGFNMNNDFSAGKTCDLLVQFYPSYGQWKK